MVLLNLSFIDSWNNVTEQEERALETLKKGMAIVFGHIPKEHITAVYVKGSFARREMNKHSDVDVSIIVDDGQYLQTLQELHAKYSKTMNPSFEFTGYSMEELKTGVFSPLGKKLRPAVPTFTRFLHLHYLIYGGALDSGMMFARTPLEMIRNMFKWFYGPFFPLYEKGKFHFDSVLKQSLWGCELAYSVKHPNFVFTTWKELATHFDGGHIIHEALRLRELGVISDVDKEDFITQLKAYVAALAEEFNVEMNT